MPSELLLRLFFRLRLALLLVGGGAFASSCTQTNEGVNPTFPNDGLLLTATPASDAALRALEGVFRPVEGVDVLTDDVVTKASRETLSFFFGNEASYAILHAGCRDGGNTFVLEGYWRRGLASERGLLRLFAQPESFARSLCNDAEPKVAGDGTSIVGFVARDDQVPYRPVRMTWQRALRPWKGRFAAIGHRAGCFPQFDCGASGNTLETIRLAPAIGADAIEIDVRLTKDGVAVLYHDPTFGSYLTDGRFCTGPVAETTFAEIRANCRMAKGESVPTLEEALEVTLNDTRLEAIYLDTKVAEVVPLEVELARRYMEKAREIGRKLVVFVGITNEEVKNAFVAAAPPGTPCLVEYSPDVTRELGCQVWSPTWTEGPQSEEVARMQAEGRAVFFWTINGVEFIDTFLKEAKPNGIVTDRPALVFYRYQMIGTEPPAPAGAP